MWRLNNTSGRLSAALGGGAEVCVATRSFAPPARNATFELWSKPLGGGRVAALLLNNGLPANASFALADLGVTGAAAVRDVNSHRDLGVLGAGGAFTAALAVHDSALLIIEPASASASASLTN